MSYKIGEVSRLAKVSIKTLHHYDAIGLLVPTGRTDSGYRLYSRMDLLRLQQILFYRELEFSLENIQRLMTAPGYDYLQALKQQKVQLKAKKDSLDKVIGLIDKTISANEEDKAMSLKEMFEVFPEITSEIMEEEERRWGHTEEHRESMRRLKNYTRADLEQMKAEADALHEQVSALFKDGAKADDPRVLDIVDQQRLLIDKWHYPCSREFYVTLLEMTTREEQYVNYIDQDCPGLAEFTRHAAKANLERKESS